MVVWLYLILVWVLNFLNLLSLVICSLLWWVVFLEGMVKIVWFFSGVGFVVGIVFGIVFFRVGLIVLSIWNFFSFLGGV